MKQESPNKIPKNKETNEARRATTLFRALNFELFVKPQGVWLKIGQLGTLAFFGTMGFLMYQAKLESDEKKTEE
eukprot:gene7440-11763_t